MKKLRKEAQKLALGLEEKELKTGPDVYRKVKGKILLLHRGRSEHIGCVRTVYQQLKRRK